jgi:hypothetical protein
MSIQDDPRIVRTQDHQYPSTLKTICTNPPILHVNQEPRAEGLKVYKSVFSARLLHPVYFNFEEDFLVFNGESPCEDFEKFTNLDSERQDPKQEVERLMMYSELRNPVLSEATC